MALAALAAWGVAFGDGPGSVTERGGVPVPKVEVEKGDSCVRDTAFMRRNHMDLLKHQRAETVREGERGSDFSLEKCQECHVSREQSCDACHSYAAVRMDCWSCHHYPEEAPSATEHEMAGALETTLKQWAGGR